jgi:hypothetical protein
MSSQAVEKYEKKTRTVKWQKQLGLQVECTEVSKNYHELQVQFCVQNGQVKGVQDFVITHLNNEELWDDTGSIAVDKFTSLLKKTVAKKKNYKVTFHEKGFIKAQLKKEKKRKLDEKKKIAVAAKKTKAAEKKNKAAAVSAAKQAKAAAKKKAGATKKTPAKTKNTKKSISKKPPTHKVYTIDPSTVRELGLQIEENQDQQVEVIKCHSGGHIKGLKGYIMFKIQNLRVYESLTSVQNLLQKLMIPDGSSNSSFTITFVKPTNLDAFIDWENSNASSVSSSSSSSSSKGKRKASSDGNVNQMQKSLKRYKKENVSLKQQLAALKKYNKELEKQNKALVDEEDEDEGMAV